MMTDWRVKTGMEKLTLFSTQQLVLAVQLRDTWELHLPWWHGSLFWKNWQLLLELGSEESLLLWLILGLHPELYWLWPRNCMAGSERHKSKVMSNFNLILIDHAKFKGQPFHWTLFKLRLWVFNLDTADSFTTKWLPPIHNHYSNNNTINNENNTRHISVDKINTGGKKRQTAVIQKVNF